ncbi:MAG: small basic protein [Phycisphaera sp.]|nr:small basic protein [Phycisphaera sp.]
MSLDPSLKTAGAMKQHRNVLTRPERIAKLQDKNRFDPQSTDPIHLPKVGNRKVAAGKKSKKKGPEDEVK